MSPTITSVRVSANGSMNAVEGSGIISMSLSLIAAQPRMLEPSMPKPSSNELSSSMLIGCEMCWLKPGRSVKRRSICRASFFLANSMASGPVVKEAARISQPLRFAQYFADATRRRASRNDSSWPQLRRLSQRILLDDHVLPHNQPSRSQLPQLRQHPADMLLPIHKHKHHRQIPARFDQARRMHPIPAIESADRMECARPRHILLTQHMQDLLPLIRFIQVNRDLYRRI